MKRSATPSTQRRSIAAPAIAALPLGMLLGAVLLPVAIAGGPLGALLALACGAIGLAAWGSRSGADLPTSMLVAFTHASGLLIGFGGCIHVIGGGISEDDAAMLMFLFTLALGFSLFAAMLLGLLFSGAEPCDERRRIRSRGVSGHRARRTKPQ